MVEGSDTIKIEDGEFSLDLGLPENFSSLATKAINAMGDLTDQYYLLRKIESANQLEELKRVFLGELQRFIPYYSLSIAQKGPNHIYFEESEKSVRSYIIDKIIKAGKEKGEKIVQTRAESMVRSDSEYIEFMEIIRKSRVFLIKVETYYKFYCKVLDSIVQSISTFKASETANKIAS